LIKESTADNIADEIIIIFCQQKKVGRLFFDMMNEQNERGGERCKKVNKSSTSNQQH
jgi:hypothetical protein